VSTCVAGQGYDSWSHAVATRSRWRRGLGFKGKGGVSGARKCDGQLKTALCRGTRGQLDVGELMCG